jgi:hypothetical protein
MCAALYATACNKFSKTQRIFTSQLSDSCALAYRLAFCADPKSFANVGRELGLDISERSARRIMDGDITAPLPVATSLLAATFAKKSTEIKDGAQSDAANNADQIIQNLQYGEKRTIDFAKADIDKFTLAINNAFLPLAYSYYLNDEPEIKIRQAASELVIKIALTPSE